MNIYSDGTVLVTHGGVEMGQGLHTKVAQVASTVLKCPISSVFISETSTDKVPNSSPTAASASSDLYGQATFNACEILRERMKPLWDELGEMATFAQVNGTQGFEGSFSCVLRVVKGVLPVGLGVLKGFLMIFRVIKGVFPCFLRYER